MPANAGFYPSCSSCVSHMLCLTDMDHPINSDIARDIVSVSTFLWEGNDPDAPWAMYLHPDGTMYLAEFTQGYIGPYSYGPSPAPGAGCNVDNIEF